MRYIVEIALALSGTGFLLSAISTFSSSWRVAEAQGESLQVGHFSACGDKLGCQHLVEILLNDHEERLSFTFMVFSVAFLFLAFVFIGIAFWRSKEEYIKIGGVTSLIGGLSALIGASIYAANFPVGSSSNPQIDQYSFGYSFALAWISSLFGIIAGLLCLSQAFKPPRLLFMKGRRTRINTVSSSNAVPE